TKVFTVSNYYKQFNKKCNHNSTLRWPLSHPSARISVQSVDLRSVRWVSPVGSLGRFWSDQVRSAPVRRCHRRFQKPGGGRRRQRAGGGTVVRTNATHSSSGSSPEMSRPRAPVTGASTPDPSSVRASSG